MKLDSGEYGVGGVETFVLCKELIECNFYFCLVDWLVRGNKEESSQSSARQCFEY